MKSCQLLDLCSQLEISLCMQEVAAAQRRCGGRDRYIVGDDQENMVGLMDGLVAWEALLELKLPSTPLLDG